MDYPIDVDDSETIVRVVKNPWHFNPKGVVRPAAFKPPKGSNETSVIRWRFATTDSREIKAKVQEIGNSGGTYTGLAHLLARACREAGTEIRDSRELFQGHADLIFPVATPADDEPLDAPAHKVMFAITEKLAKAKMDLIDPDPDGLEWTITALPAPSP